MLLAIIALHLRIPCHPHFYFADCHYNANSLGTCKKYVFEQAEPYVGGRNTKGSVMQCMRIANSPTGTSSPPHPFGKLLLENNPS